MILDGITRQQCLKDVSVLVAAYYLILFLKCRRGSGTMRLAGRGGRSTPGRFTEPARSRTEKMLLTSAEEDVRGSASWDQYHFSEPIVGEVNTLISKIKEVVLYGASRQCDERYVSDRLQTVIRQYPGLKDDVFRRAVRRLIQAQLALYDLPELSEQEMNNIWIEDISPGSTEDWL
jgi:hypothetical protein